MTLRENVSLRPFNTFGIPCRARWFAEIEEIADLRELSGTDTFRDASRLVLGGGSNVLFNGDYGGLVILNRMKGIEVIDEDDLSVWLRIRGGENWHDVVQYCVDRNWGDIENLALIPGSTGAAPIQNIGAYGTELKDVFISLEAFDWSTGNVRVFFKSDCAFGYRDSVFKHRLKGRVMILSVILKLSKMPKVNTSYGAIREVLEKKGIEKPGIADVFRAVIDIRRSKLPDPKEIGNAGSFFKNPELPKADAERILDEYPGAPSWPLDDGRIKIPAGWMIEKCGWKGHRSGDVGVHDKQALVLVNYGSGTGTELCELAGKIRKDVKEKFGVELTPEVNIID